MATAKGFRSTPATASSARWVRISTAVPGSCFSHWAAAAETRPAEKVAGAAGRVDQAYFVQAELFDGGSRVRSGMNSSTNSGV